MSTVSIIDFFTILVSTVGLTALLLARKSDLPIFSKVIISGFFMGAIAYSMFLFFEWSGLTNSFEWLEDLIGALLPIFGILLVASLVDTFKKQELLRGKNRIELALEGAELAIWDWDVQTGKMHVNDRWAEMLGYKCDEIDQDFSIYSKLVNPDDYTRFRTEIDKHLNGEHGTFSVEMRFRNKLGEWIWIRCHGKVLEFSPNGKALRAAGTHLDITESKQMAEDLKLKNEEYLSTNEELNESLQSIRNINAELEEAMEKAEQSDRLKTVFLANLSHEIRTPMNGILGFAELLSSPDLDIKTQQDYIGIIKQSGNRMLNIINDLVDISKIEAGQIEIKPEETNLNDLMNKLYVFFNREAIAKGLDLRLKLGLDYAESGVVVDPNRLEQVISNLVKNALKFTEQGRVYFGYRVADDNLMFWVQDSGKGISEDQKAIVFDRFRQADDNPYNAEEGSGLGLAISKALVELMDGQIWADSEMGEGSTFSILLPYVPVVGTKLAPLEFNAENYKFLKGLRVLVAEDDQVSFYLLREILDAVGVDYQHAINGKEAVDAFLDHKQFDAVLMDMKMPLMSGVEATRAIRETDAGIPILAQTAYVSDSDRKLAMKAGCNAVVSKPIDRKELLDSLLKHMKKTS